MPDLASLAGFGFGQRVEQRQRIDAALAAWAGARKAADAERELRRAGIPAAALASSRDLVECGHLRERGFWDDSGAGLLPGLPWRASFGRIAGPAPGLGADTDAVLRDVLGLAPDAIDPLRRSGALG